MRVACGVEKHGQTRAHSPALPLAPHHGQQAVTCVRCRHEVRTTPLTLDSPVVASQDSNAGDTGSIPGWATKITYAMLHGEKNLNKKKKAQDGEAIPTMSSTHTPPHPKFVPMGKPGAWVESASVCAEYCRREGEEHAQGQRREDPETGCTERLWVKTVTGALSSSSPSCCRGHPPEWLLTCFT